MGSGPVHLGHHFFPSTQNGAWPPKEDSQEKVIFVNTFSPAPSTTGHVLSDTDDSDPVLTLPKLEAW